MEPFQCSTDTFSPFWKVIAYIVRYYEYSEPRIGFCGVSSCLQICPVYTDTTDSRLQISERVKHKCVFYRFIASPRFPITSDSLHYHVTHRAFSSLITKFYLFYITPLDLQFTNASAYNSPSISAHTPFTSIHHVHPFNKKIESASDTGIQSSFHCMNAAQTPLRLNATSSGIRRTVSVSSLPLRSLVQP